jgi:hypothetical protein
MRKPAAAIQVITSYSPSQFPFLRLLLVIFLNYSLQSCNGKLTVYLTPLKAIMPFLKANSLQFSSA